MKTNSAGIYLLSSKMSAPRMPDNVILRQRLDHLVITDRPLVLFCAPAGFGKTTAALQAFQSKKQRSSDAELAWFSLDPEDDDERRFCSYLISAIANKIEISQSLLSAAVDPETQIKAVLGQLLFELSRIKQDLFIVVDDYHHIADQNIHQIMAYFIRNLPPQVRLFMTTRIEPPACIMSLQLRGLVHKISLEDLSFTSAETKQFLTQNKHIHLTSHESEAILQVVEGWPIGLQLVVLDSKSHDSFQDIMQRISHNNLNIIGYFDAEIFSFIPEYVQLFMLKSSILKRFNLQVSSALIPEVNACQCIDYLFRNHLFVSMLEEDAWYRYHHLLREFLLHRLNISDVNVTELHILASKSFLSQNILATAAEHAVASGSQDLAREILELHGEELIHKAHYDIVNRCLELVPKHVILSDPKLLQVICWVEAIYGDAKNVENLLEQSEQLLVGIDGKQKQELSAEFSIVRAQAHFALHQYDQALAQVQGALKLLDPANSRRQSALIIQANILNERGQSQHALEIFEEASLLGRKEKNHDGVLWALIQQADIYKSQGDFQSSIQCSRYAVQYAEDNNVNYGFNYLFANLNLSEIALEQFHLRESRRLVKKMGKICANWKHYWTIHLTGWLLRTEMLKGKPSVAKELADKHAQIFNLPETSEQLLPYGIETQLLWWWSIGDIRSIQSWQKTHIELNAYKNSRDFMVFRAEIYALIATQNITLAMTRLEEQITIVNQSELILEQTKLELLNVVVVSYVDVSQAAKLLVEVLPKIVKVQLVASTLMYKKWLSPVLGQLDVQTLSGEILRFVDQLQLLEKQKNTSLVKGNIAVPDDLIAMGVSKKEWLVFEKIIAGDSNEKIANSMFVAVSTVKTHINNLYKKLNVQNRKEAINAGMKYSKPD